MTEIEQKSLNAQVQLLKDITECDHMILHLIQGKAHSIFSDIVRPAYLSQKEGKVELNVEEFLKIYEALQMFATEEGFAKINNWIESKYIEPKKIYKKTLSLLT